MDHHICVEGGEQSVCASYNPLGLLFIVSNQDMAAAGKTQACLLASGKAQTATVLKCFDLSSAVVLQGLLLKVKMDTHMLKLKAKDPDYVMEVRVILNMQTEYLERAWLHDCFHALQE